MNWFVYIVETSDKFKSFYTGYTNNLKKRIYNHNYTSRGAKYTRTRRPVKLVYKEIYESKLVAFHRERVIKKLTRKEKERLVYGQ